MKVVSVLGVRNLENEERESRIQYLNELFKSLLDQQEIVQEIIIDGASYREGYNGILIDKIMNIQSVEIRTKQESVLMGEIKADLQGYLPKLIQACDSISDLLYGEMNQEEFSYLAQLLEGIQWVGESVYALHTYASRLQNRSVAASGLQKFLDQLDGQVKELATVLDRNDYTAAGDIIKYELAGLFTDFAKDLEAVVIS